MNAVTHQESSQLISPEGLAATLQSVQIDGQLDGLLLRMKTRQHYKNTRKTNLEAVYTFPLPWGATLLGLNAEIDGHRLQGTVMEKKQATQRYEKAIDEGDTPIMVERSARGLYTANLGNLKPGEDAVIEIEYAQLLRFEQGQIRITVPTTVGPRYGDAHKTGGLAAHESVSASVLAEYPLTVKITLTGEVALAAVQCPSHAVAMSRLEDAMVVTLQQGGFLDRDFVLLLQGLQGQSFASVAPDGDGFAVLASFCPTLPEKTQEPVYLKVLVDCSGSMGGDSIAAARRALHEVMKELTEQDWISYSRFGDKVKHELSGLQSCNAATIKQVAGLISNTDADLGGTEMNTALISTFELGMAKSFKTLFTTSESQNHNHSKDVLLITDGDIWHVEAVIELARRSGHRIFAIGVGSAPAESLLREVAEKSGGACELVALNQDVAAVIVRMFRRMRSVRCTEVKVDWGQGTLWQSTSPTSLYGGDTLHLCAKLAKLPESAPQLTWVTDTQPMQTSARQLQNQSAELLPRLVASQQIVQLIRGNEGQDQTLALALNYQLVTDQTNLILVHVREEGSKAEGLPELDKVKHMLAAGWGGVGSVDALHGGIALSRFRGGSNVQMSYRVGNAMPDLGSCSTPSVWRTRSAVSASVDPLSISAMGDFDIPAFLRKQADDSDLTANIKKILRPSPRKLVKGTRETPLAILQTFEASAQKLLAPHRFVSNLQAMNLPADMVSMLDDLTVVLGTGAKAWAVVLQWLVERFSDQIILSRQSERLLRQVLKDEDLRFLQELKLTWAARIDAFMNHELVPEGSADDDEEFEIPEFLRKQAD
jgi:Ca-activated chloride channel family protein